MNKNSSFVYFKKYKNYVKQKDQIPANSLVFVEDRNSIWTHGVEFGGSGVTIEQDGNSWTFKDNAGEVLSTITVESITQEQVQQLIASGVTITVDSALSDTSTNAIQNKVVKAALDLKLNSSNYVVDKELSNESTNPVQNKVVKAAFDGIRIPSLSGYLKKSDADDTYATKDDLDQLDVDTSSFLTSSDLEDYCTSADIAETYATKQEMSAKADSSSLSAYATVAALNNKADTSTLNTKVTELKTWVEGKNYLTEHQSLEDYATKEDLTNIDTSVFLLVDELPEDDINTNKIYIYNNTQYRYIPEPEVEDGEEVPEGDYGWVAIGEANTQVDLTPYLRSATAASTYATKTSVQNLAQDLEDYVPILSVYYPSGDIPYTPEGQEGYEDAIKLIDTTINAASVNPIQNKAVAEALAGKADSSTVSSTYATKQALADALSTASSTYATKSALTTGLQGKQDTLTAGTGISISNGVISSTVDTNPYIFVEELPVDLSTVNPNKIYVLEIVNIDGTTEFKQYRYKEAPEFEDGEPAPSEYPWIEIGKGDVSIFALKSDLQNLALKSDINTLRSLINSNAQQALTSTDLTEIRANITNLQNFVAGIQDIYQRKDSVVDVVTQDEFDRYVANVNGLYAPANIYATDSDLLSAKEIIENKISATQDNILRYLHQRLNWIQQLMMSQYVLKKDTYDANQKPWSEGDIYEFDINEAIDGPTFVTMTKLKYDELVALGLVNKNTYYFTYEGEDEPAGKTWQFGGTFPITLTDNWTFGGTFPIRLK